MGLLLMASCYIGALAPMLMVVVVMMMKVMVVAVAVLFGALVSFVACLRALGFIICLAVCLLLVHPYPAPLFATLLLLAARVAIVCGAERAV